MKHLGTVQIDTDRLVLRKFNLLDAQAMFNNWANDPEVTKFLMWPAHKSVEVSEDILSDWIRNYSDKMFYQWAIVLKENGDEPIGNISV